MVATEASRRTSLPTFVFLQAMNAVGNGLGARIPRRIRCKNHTPYPGQGVRPVASDATKRRTVPPVALIVSVLLVLVAGQLPYAANAIAADPKLRWRTITTEHFSVHYPSSAEEIARKSANIAEEAHSCLASFFDAPDSIHTNIVIVDPGDSSNGYASVDRYNLITLLAFHPGPDGDLGDADDYLRMLLFHEYTHILHLSMSSGIPGLLTRLGLSMRPHQNLPNWFIEGLATWVETKNTEGGRNHRGFFEMYLRTASLGDKLPSLAQLGGNPYHQPRTTGWYAFGGSFISFLVENYGEDRLREFLRVYSRRIVPLGYNAVAKQVFGSTWDDMQETWHRDLRIRYGRWKTEQEQLGLTPASLLTQSGEFQRNPALSPSHKLLVYRSSTGEGIETLRLRNLETGHDYQAVTCRGGCGRPSFSADSQSILFTKSERFDTVYNFDDLFRYDIGSDTTHRITWGRRVHFPTPSPDGQSVVFATSQYGRSGLILRDLESGRETDVVSAKGLRQVAHPQFSPDGRRIVFSMHQYNVWDLYIVELETGNLTRLTADDAADMTPCFAPDGHTVIYASSGEYGPELYAIDIETKRVNRLTRTLTGSIDPTTDGNSVIFSQYSTQGWDLAKIPLSEMTTSRTMGPNKTVAGRTKPSRLRYEPQHIHFPESDYNPLLTLYPATWLPEFRFVSPDTATLQLVLTGSDAVQLHSWSIATHWNIDDPFPSVALSYRNQHYVPSVGLSAAWFRRPRIAFDAFNTEVVDEDVALGSLDVSVPFPNNSGSFTTNFRIDITKGFLVETPSFRPDPATGIPYVPSGATHLGFSFTWRYDNRESFYYSISPETGRRIGTSLLVRTSLLDADSLTYTARWQWNEYFAMPYARAHVLALRYDGGISGGDPGRKEGFRLGGIPERDLIEDILEERGLGAGLLRGFLPDAFRGDQIHLFNVEYRLPIWYIHDGFTGFPVFIERLHGALFFDMGTATSEPLLYAPWNMSLGAELRTSATLMSGTATHFRLGLAHGLGEFGIFQVYFVSGTGF